MTPIRIFISYAREDSVAADRLFDTLATHPQLEPWLDRKKLHPGDDWKRVIMKQIDESDFILILLSSRSISKTGFVQLEMREAIQRALMRPPGQRFIIPVRLDNCLPLFDELNELHYLDLFPDWESGVNKLYESFGVKHYTHQYVTQGVSKYGRSRLAPLGEKVDGEEINVQLVDVSSIPEMDLRLIPDDGMRRDGAQLWVYLKLWDIAVDWPATVYRKRDWSDLDNLLFGARRTQTEKEQLVQLFTRLWAVARQLTPYDEDDWRALRKLILAR